MRAGRPGRAHARAFIAALSAALLLAAGGAWARRAPPERPVAVEGGEPGEAPADPEEELADIQRRIDRKDLPKIQFDFDSAGIRRESYLTLDLIAGLLRRNPQYKLQIFAHTCNIGSDKYNLELSRRRALAVKTYLVKRGIPPPYIRVFGKGASQPLASNDTEAGRERNRRVEFRLLRRWWSSVY